MKRKLTLAMLFSLSATSHLAMALGVGEVEVSSTLNAPLRASIPLTDVTGLEPGLIKASIADDRAYAAAGLERTPLAASVRLAIAEREGRLMLEMTSERAIREPWLDLLLRFDWPSGQQLREVTLLLDPPNYDNMPALVMGGAAATRPSDAPSSARESAPAPRAVSRAAPSGGADNAARVSSGDTLWSVASRLRPDSGISMDQMMVALVEANPEVFPSGNINAMRAGFTLVVPSRDALAARTESAAQRIVQAMNQAWANRGSGAPARVPLGNPSATAQAEMASAAQPPASDGGVAGDDAAGDNEDSAVAESATEPTASEAQGARLTLLTDAQAAASRVSAGETEGTGSDIEEGESERAGEAGLGAGSRQVVISPDVLQALYGDGELTRDARLLRLESRWVESQDALEDVRAERDALQASLGDMRAELDAMRDRLAALSAGGQGDNAPGAGGVVSPLDAADQAADAPWWGALYQAEANRSLMVGGAGLAALLALWALVRQRRRRDRSEAHAFGSVQVVGPPGAGVVSPGAVDRHEEQAAPVRASMPQAEAINEADIFIAYGRFDQARELLEASLDKEPGRDDLRLKLLMVHLEQGNRQDAIRQAERLQANPDPAIQAEVARLMGRLGESPMHATGDGDRLAEEDGGDEAAKAQATPVETAEHDNASEASSAEAEMPAEMAPELNSREDEQGREIIDYRPPALDPAPAARQETPMQPSIEFTSSVAPPDSPAEPGGTASASTTGTFFGNDLSDDWHVEEVAFPSLDQDNAPPAVGASASDALDQARELLQAGDAGRARSLLTDLATADDATTREEAQSLLTRHDL